MQPLLKKETILLLLSHSLNWFYVLLLLFHFEICTFLLSIAFCKNLKLKNTSKLKSLLYSTIKVGINIDEYLSTILFALKT